MAKRKAKKAKSKAVKKAAAGQKVEIIVKTEAPRAKPAKRKSVLGKYKVASAGVVAAIVGGILKLTEITKTFPYPADMVGNVIIFCAVIGIAIDLAKGGLLD